MFVRINQALEASRVRREENEKGFTLIELLVVVLIIGVLAAIAIPIFLGQQESARENAAQAQVTQAKTAIVAALVAGDLDAPVTFPVSGATIPGFTNSADIPVIVTGTKDGFCVQAHHVGSPTKTFAVDDEGAASAGICTTGGTVGARPTT